MDGDALAVVLGADDGFALGLAVTGRSVLDHRPPGATTTLWVLDLGLSASTHEKLRASWDGAEVEVVPADPGSFKLRIGELLPGLERAVYIDTDVLVRDDLAGLPMPAGDDVVSAVQDTMIPHLGIDFDPADLPAAGTEPYFNSGVMGLDLDRWRTEAVGERARAIQAEHGSRFWSRDQQALNLALLGAWTPAPLRWNRMSHLEAVPAGHRLCFAAEEVAAAVADPAVAHFAGAAKPWLGSYPVEQGDEWFAVLDRTAWSGWRPEALGTWHRLVRRPHGQLDFARRGAQVAHREGLSRGPWLRSAAGVVAHRPWTVATYPAAQARDRLRR